jgi:hypothetical protein
MEVSKLHAPAALPLGNNPVIHWIEDWMGSRASLDVFREEKSFLPLPGFEPCTVQPVA